MCFLCILAQFGQLLPPNSVNILLKNAKLEQNFIKIKKLFPNTLKHIIKFSKIHLALSDW